jgi:hypothetical protein
MIICGSYLGYRAGRVMLRVRRARHAYPALSLPPAAPTDPWTDRCQGAFIGLAVGDALGMPAESLPPVVAPLALSGRSGHAARSGALSATPG